MYFYIDESGQTGKNISDEKQPNIYYGIISSPVNIDLLLSDKRKKFEERLGTERIHANEQGEKLSLIANDIANIIKRFDVRFDFIRMNKRDLAIIAFYDQVFDSINNRALPEPIYNTPLRYLLLFSVASIFDDYLIDKAWRARVDINKDRSNQLLREVCLELLGRVIYIRGNDFQKLIKDALVWTVAHPTEIMYGPFKKKDSLLVCPNIACFEFVLMHIADRLKIHGRRAKQIVLDRQDQFNSSQILLREVYAKYSTIEKESNVNSENLFPFISFKEIPKCSIVVKSSGESMGLALVDIMLWLYKRKIDNEIRSEDLRELVKLSNLRAKFEDFSIEALKDKWMPEFLTVPF